MANMFCFDPAEYADQFANNRFVHIKNGVSEEFLAQMKEQVAQSLRGPLMQEYAIGDKEQAVKLDGESIHIAVVAAEVFEAAGQLGDAATARVKELYEPLGMSWRERFGFANNYGLAMRPERSVDTSCAAKHQLQDRHIGSPNGSASRDPVQRLFPP